ncbi:whey acidic protein-like [Amphibalanus amphitrite]|uniref:whey acidic protein-like n=1 Tax=Amphibalanus amphitrite TaxID=1232801 RepID=UPI001C91B42C|nr:whey acidic protein-like [Amphibalanus amphitrite]
MLRWCLVLLLAAVGVSGYQDISRCTYFCRTSDGRFFCCHSGDQGAHRPVVHPGRCPPVRPQCPPSRQRPRTCAHDGDCPRSSKCCYDTCLEWTVCKPALGFSEGIIEFEEFRFPYRKRG